MSGVKKKNLKLKPNAKRKREAYFTVSGVKKKKTVFKVIGGKKIKIFKCNVFRKKTTQNHF